MEVRPIEINFQCASPNCRSGGQAPLGGVCISDGIEREYCKSCTRCGFSGCKKRGTKARLWLIDGGPRSSSSRGSSKFICLKHITPVSFEPSMKAGSISCTGRCGSSISPGDICAWTSPVSVSSKTSPAAQQQQQQQQQSGTPVKNSSSSRREPYHAGCLTCSGPECSFSNSPIPASVGAFLVGFSSSDGSVVLCGRHVAPMLPPRKDGLSRVKGSVRAPHIAPGDHPRLPESPANSTHKNHRSDTTANPPTPHSSSSSSSSSSLPPPASSSSPSAYPGHIIEPLITTQDSAYSPQLTPSSSSPPQHSYSPPPPSSSPSPASKRSPLPPASPRAPSNPSCCQHLPDLPSAPPSPEPGPPSIDPDDFLSSLPELPAKSGSIGQRLCSEDNTPAKEADLLGAVASRSVLERVNGAKARVAGIMVRVLQPNGAYGLYFVRGTRKTGDGERLFECGYSKQDDSQDLALFHVKSISDRPASKKELDRLNDQREARGLVKVSRSDCIFARDFIRTARGMPQLRASVLSRAPAGQQVSSLASRRDGPPLPPLAGDGSPLSMCNQCNKRVGRWTWNGSKWCPECYTCVACLQMVGKAGSTMPRYRGKPLCTRCSQTPGLVVRCRCCHRPLIDPDRDRLVQRSADERSVCASCLEEKRSIVTQEHALVVGDAAKDWYEKNLGIQLGRAVKAVNPKLVPASGMKGTEDATIVGPNFANAHTFGQCQWARNSAGNVRVQAIRVLYGLSSTMATAVLVHEYMHALEAVTRVGKERMSVEYTEGIAELACWLFLNDLKASGVLEQREDPWELELVNKEIKTMENRKSAPYGTGFQMMRRLYIDHGRDLPRTLRSLGFDLSRTSGINKQARTGRTRNHGGGGGATNGQQHFIPPVYRPMPPVGGRARAHKQRSSSKR